MHGTGVSDGVGVPANPGQVKSRPQENSFGRRVGRSVGPLNMTFRERGGILARAKGDEDGNEGKMEEGDGGDGEGNV